MLKRQTALLSTAPLVLMLTSSAAFSSDQKPNETVFVANSSNGRILKIDFEEGTATVVNTDATLRKGLEGLAVRDDGAGQVNLLVCDRLDGKVVFYANAAGTGATITAQIPMPDGISLDRDGNAFLISSGAGGGAAQHARQVWAIPRGQTAPGGYGPAQLIDAANPSDLLADARIVTFPAGSLKKGDLLVLARKPAQVWLYPGAVPCADPAACTANERQAFVPADAFPPGTDANGMVQGPDGNLLIVTGGGDVLRYNVSTQAFEISPLISGLGNGPFKIAVGFQNVPGPSGLVARTRAFVTQRNITGRVLSFDFDGATAVQSHEVSAGLQAPVGVGIGTGKAVPTPAAPEGTKTVVTLDHIDSTFDHVNVSGFTDSTCIALRDPRETDQGFQERPLNLKELDSRLPDRIIPSYVRTFLVGAPAAGDPIFFVCLADTSAGFVRTIDSHEDEATQLHYQPDCLDPDPSLQPRFFWVPADGEPPIVEKDGTTMTLIDVSSACRNTGSNRAVTPDYSILLPIVRDTRPVTDIVGFKLQSLGETLTSFAPFVRNTGSCQGVYGTLTAGLQAATEAFAPTKGKRKSDPAAAIIQLQSFVAITDGNPSCFDDSQRNVNGELVARAQSAIFMLGKLVQPKGPARP